MGWIQQLKMKYRVLMSLLTTLLLHCTILFNPNYHHVSHYKFLTETPIVFHFCVLTASSTFFPIQLVFNIKYSSREPMPHLTSSLQKNIYPINTLPIMELPLPITSYICLTNTHDFNWQNNYNSINFKLLNEINMFLN